MRAATAPRRGRQIAEVERPAGNGHRGLAVVAAAGAAEGSGGDPRLGETRRRRYRGAMPTFDIVSQVDMQEVRNAVDQAQRELATRFDFKGTESTVELHDMELRLHSSTEDRLRAVVQVLEEKLVRRKVSLKALEYGKVEEAAKGTARQTVSLKAGLSSDNTKAINRWIKDHGPEGGLLPDPGGPGPGIRQEARRSADGHRRAAGRGLRAAAAVREHAGLTGPGSSRPSSSGPTPASAAGRCGPRSAGGRRTGS